MRKLSVIALILTMGALSSQGAFAKSQCRSRFESHIRYLLRLANSLSAPCWREVDKGEGNVSRIRQYCSKEMSTVFTMKSHKDQLTNLCYDSTCNPELKKLKVCIPGKRLAYYKKVLRL